MRRTFLFIFLAGAFLLVSCNREDPQKMMGEHFPVFAPFEESGPAADWNAVRNEIAETLENEYHNWLAENLEIPPRKEIEIIRTLPKGCSFEKLGGKNLQSPESPSRLDYSMARKYYVPFERRKSIERAGWRRGCPVTETVIIAALRWLHFHQSEDGRWDSDGFDKNCDPRNGPTCDGHGASHYDIAVTSLSLLAFMGFGDTHQSGLFTKTVRRGLKWLQSKQEEDGSFGRSGAEDWIYNHAIATITLCEAYAMTRDYRLRKNCEKAVRFAIDARNPDGGWGLGQRDKRSNASVTGWMALAFNCAGNAGIDVPDSVFGDMVKWFHVVTDMKGKAGYIYKGIEIKGPRGTKHETLPTMTAISSFCRTILGRERLHKKTLGAVDILMENPPCWNKPKNTTVDLCYWFWGTLAMYQFGGRKLYKWKTELKKSLYDTQRVGGCADGSWDPAGRWGEIGGRIYATALNCLTMEIVHLLQVSTISRGKSDFLPFWRRVHDK